MNENQEIMRDLVFLHKVFAICFMLFVVMFIIISASFMREVRAYNQCASVDDNEFAACYQLAKQ
jgi:hypothetical protein